MSLLQVFGVRIGKSIEQQRLQIVLPQQINNLFVGQNGISVAYLRSSRDEDQAQQRLPQMARCLHKRTVDRWSAPRQFQVLRIRPSVPVKDDRSSFSCSSAGRRRFKAAFPIPER